MSRYLDDLLLLIGCAAITYGTWQFSPPLAWIVGGFLALLWGVALGLASRAVGKGVGGEEGKAQ